MKFLLIITLAIATIGPMTGCAGRRAAVQGADSMTNVRSQAGLFIGAFFERPVPVTAKK